MLLESSDIAHFQLNSLIMRVIVGFATHLLCRLAVKG